jgi:hypothetical protein
VVEVVAHLEPVAKHRHDHVPRHRIVGAALPGHRRDGDDEEGR